MYIQLTYNLQYKFILLASSPRLRINFDFSLDVRRRKAHNLKPKL